MDASRAQNPLPDDASGAIDQLDRVLESAIGDDRPVDALATIKAAGDVLTRRSREAAAAATQGAWTWADVGDALGISKQAAHQRLGAKIMAKREKLDRHAKAGHDQIATKFAKARAHLDQHPADEDKIIHARTKIDDAERARHAKLSRTTKAVHERLDRYERDLAGDDES